MVKRNNRRKDLSRLGLSLVAILLLNYICSFYFHRFDLTSEKRFTLSPQSKAIAENIQGSAFFKVYLDGKLPAGLIRLRDETKEMLDEFRAYSGGKIQYEFIDPSANPNEDENMAFYKQLYKQGLSPIDLMVNDKSGSSHQTIFPGALVAYRGREIPMEILQNQGNQDPQEALNYSIEELEYDIDNTIHKLSIDYKPQIGFLHGQYELDTSNTASAAKALKEYYDVRDVTINHNIHSLKDYRAIIIAKPDSAFDDKDLFILDQYIMHGGKVLWLISPVYAPMDSLERNGLTYAFPNNCLELSSSTNEFSLRDLLFSYGVRLNANVVEDIQCSKIPVNVAYRGEQPKFQPYDWVFNPLIGPVSGQSGDNPIVKNLNLVQFSIASTLDTIAAKGIKKTILLTTSKYTRVVATPTRISAHMATMKPDEFQFKKPYQKVAVLLEGKFKSPFNHHITLAIDTSKAIDFMGEGKPSAMIVVSDGSVIRNATKYGGKYALPLGQDLYSPALFSNKDFVVNCMNYLCGDSTLLYVRGRELQLRPLDSKKVNLQRTQWQVINMVVPILIIIALGLVLAWRRKERWAR